MTKINQGGWPGRKRDREPNGVSRARYPVLVSIEVFYKHYCEVANVMIRKTPQGTDQRTVQGKEKIHIRSMSCDKLRNRYGTSEDIKHTTGSTYSK
jgi:hypothetical protein